MPLDHRTPELNQCFAHAAVTLMFLLGTLICSASCSHPSAGLIQQFQERHVFFEQFEVAKTIVARNDPSVLPGLLRYLGDEDRHERANAAYVFAGLGQQQGFDVLFLILSDLSDRPDGQGRVDIGGIIPVGGPMKPTRHTQQQIEADRYYAAHVLGKLKDPRAVPALISVLDIPQVNMAAIWSLAEIGDNRAVSPLIAELQNEDPSVRVLTIRALEKLHAKEAIPALRSLLADPEKSHVDDLVSVADAAKHALSRLD